MQYLATPRNPVKYFEVLAGAISWGFKSPSPHQFSACNFKELQADFHCVPKLYPLKTVSPCTAFSKVVMRS